MGKAWLGAAGLPLMISALRASALSAGFLGIQIRSGAAGRGSARRGEAWSGRLWQGLRKQHWGLRLPLLLSSESRFGRYRPASEWQGWERSSAAGYGKDCRRQYGGFALPTVLSGAGRVRLGMANYGQDGRVSVGLGDFGLG